MECLHDGAGLIAEVLLSHSNLIITLNISPVDEGPPC